MQIDFIWNLLISLGLTIVLELVFCSIFKLRGAYNLTLVVLVNIITNPPVVLLNHLLKQNTSLPSVLIVLVLEISAVLIEGLYYKLYIKDIKRPLLFSLGANAFSYFSGLLIFSII